MIALLLAKAATVMSGSGMQCAVHVQASLAERAAAECGDYCCSRSLASRGCYLEVDCKADVRSSTGVPRGFTVQSLLQCMNDDGSCCSTVGVCWPGITSLRHGPGRVKAPMFGTF